MECLAPLRRRSVDCSISAMRMMLRSRTSSSMWNIYEPQSSFSSFDSGSGDDSPTESFVEQDIYKNQRWYAGRITRLMAENVLEDLRDGSFLVRKSTEANSEYTYTIAIKWMNRVFHFRVYTRDGHLSISTDGTYMFTTMEELIGHFEEHSLGIYFPSINTVLKYPYKDEQPSTSFKLETEERSAATSVDSVRPVDVTLPLIDQPWYHGEMTRVDAENLLSTKPIGSFLLRDCESYRTGYSLSIRHSSSEYLHIRVSEINDRYILGQYSKPFDTVAQCIAHYCKESLRIKRGLYAVLLMPVCR